MYKLELGIQDRIFMGATQCLNFYAVGSKAHRKSAPIWSRNLSTTFVRVFVGGNVIAVR